MPEARTDTTEARPLGPATPEAGSAAAAEAASGPGRHRGHAAAEEAQADVHGKHRRPGQE